MNYRKGYVENRYGVLCVVCRIIMNGYSSQVGPTYDTLVIWFIKPLGETIAMDVVYATMAMVFYKTIWVMAYDTNVSFLHIKCV